jgi:hypothetical protein
MGGTEWVNILKDRAIRRAIVLVDAEMEITNSTTYVMLATFATGNGVNYVSSETKRVI